MDQELLMNALADLEKGATLRKGDALVEHPHDGGFATEGTNIQTLAKNQSNAVKALMKGGMSKSDATKMVKALAKSDDDSMSEDDDSGSSDDGDADSMSSDMDSSSDEGGEMPPMMKGKKVSKSLGASKLDASSRREKTGRSLRKSMMEENPDLENAIDVTPILGQFVTHLEALANKSDDGSSFATLRKSIAATQHQQMAFNTRLAKAMTIIGESIMQVSNLVKAMANEPAPRNLQLKKSQIVQPSFQTDNTSLAESLTGGGESPLSQIAPMVIQDALVDMCMKSESGVSAMMVTNFENARCNLSMLPPNVLKTLEQKLCPDSAS